MRERVFANVSHDYYVNVNGQVFYHAEAVIASGDVDKP
jgi:hypothetical protein